MSDLDPDIRRAAALLRRGGLVAFPTETVYGLGADAEDPAAVARVFRAKGRPAGHPLIVHGAGAEVLERYARDVPAAARLLADRRWPGPLTLVLLRSGRVPDAVTGGRDTVALRVPAHPVAQALLAAVGRGVAAPSANPFGRVSATTADHVRADLAGRVDLVLDGGPCPVGVESTILDLSGPAPALLRAGAVPAAELEALLGVALAREADGPARAPGMLAAHYAPRARVEVVAPAAVAARAAELAGAGVRVAVLGPAPLPPLPPGALALGAAGGAAGYAHELYALLRAADAAGAAVVLALPPPGGGIAEAVRDRLTRAARAGAP